MALSQSTLSTQLRNLAPTGSEATAITRLVSAWQTYFGGATVSGAALVPSSIAAGLSAMQSALAGMSASGQGAAKIASAVSAFWTAQLSLATSMWITAPIVLVPPIVPPAGLSGLSSALSSAFASNVSSHLSLNASCDAVAAVIHAATTGATVPGSVPPASPAPIPIL